MTSHFKEGRIDMDKDITSGCPLCGNEEVMSKIKEINDYLDYCIEHESNASDNGTSIKAESYSRVIHDMYGKTKKILDEFVEIKGKSNE